MTSRKSERVFYSVTASMDVSTVLSYEVFDFARILFSAAIGLSLVRCFPVCCIVNLLGILPASIAYRLVFTGSTG